ncbi:hypothetical protein [Streptococcus suis]|uniref:hypothetical protein n=1 Tax=Streptococcus suis TaxID=1307 RepID=UPI0012ACA227|nr:hypothetical protein [Streptococcus suis]
MNLLYNVGTQVANNVTQNIANQTVRHVAKAGVEAGVETVLDTGVSLATGNPISLKNVVTDYGLNFITNGSGSVSSKKSAKADVPKNKPKSGDVAVTKSRKDVTPVQQLSNPGPNKSRIPVEAVDGNGNKVYGEILEPGYIHTRPVKDVTSTSSNTSTSQKLISGPDPNALRLEAPKDSSYEPFLPDDYYKQRLPERVSPGTTYLHKYSVDGDIVQTKFYDAHGREKGWVDYTTHNQPGHTNPHSHQRIYNQHTPEQGYKIDYRTDPYFPKWLGD